MKDKQAYIHPWQNAASGAVAGFMSRLVIAPADIVKIRIQLQRKESAAVGKGASSPVKYRGLIQAFRTINREEGLLAFWKGNLSAQILYVSYGGTQFIVYSQAKSWLQSLGIGEKANSFTAGAIAGSVATFATYPFDLLRTRFVAQGNERVLTSFKHALACIYREEGIKGFYRGLWPSLLQIGPYMGIMFSAYNTVQLLLSRISGENRALNATAAGAFAGIVSKVVVMPFDVLRKRLQVQGPKLAKWVVPVNVVLPKLNLYHCWRQIVHQEGIFALWRGTSLAVLKTAPSSAITFGTFELCTQFWRRHNTS